MATTTTGRITVVLRAGEALAGRVPLPSGPQAELIERLETVGFTRSIAEAGTVASADAPANGHLIRILVDSGVSVERGGTSAAVVDVFERKGSGPIPRDTLRAIVADLDGYGLRVLVDVAERHEGHLVRIELLDEKLLTR